MKLLAAVLLLVLTLPSAAYAEQRTPAQATAHALDELANCRAQQHPECPTETPTATPSPTTTPSPTATPSPTDTPVPPMPPTPGVTGELDDAAAADEPTMAESPTDTPTPTLIVITVVVSGPAPPPQIIYQQLPAPAPEVVYVVATAEPAPTSTPVATRTPTLTPRQTASPTTTPAATPTPAPQAAVAAPVATPALADAAVVQPPPGVHPLLLVLLALVGSLVWMVRRRES